MIDIQGINNNNLLKEYIQNNPHFFCNSIPVKTELEIVKTMLLYEQERKYRPTVLFTNVINYSRIPVLMNPFKKEVICRSITDSSNYLSVLYDHYQYSRPKVNILKHKNLEKLDSLFDIPILKHQVGDGGRYITAGVTASKCPQTNTINLGIYRIQVVDRKKALIFMNPKTDGYKNYLKYTSNKKGAPVTIFIGANMMYYLCGAAKMPYSSDDYQTVSRLLGQPIDLYDFEVPAPVESQFIITGFIKDEKEWEGGFGEFKGYYCERRLSPVLEVEEILCCKSPFYTSIAAGKESGLSLSAIQGEYLMYSHLRELGLQISSITYRLEEAGEFVAVIESPEPSEEMLRKALEFDKRLKFVICGQSVKDPWRELSIFPFKTIQEDYYFHGNISGKRVGFIFEPRPPMNPVEIF